MIIWSGFGFLPIVFVVVFMLAFGADQQNAPGHDRNLAYALLLTGIVSGALGWWFRTRPARTFIDKATGKEVVFRRRHSLFFIPMVYWGPIFIAMAIYQFANIKH